METFLKDVFIGFLWQLKRGGIPTVRNSEKLTIYNATKLNKFYGGCSSMVECATVARETRVRFPSSALLIK